MSSYRARNSFLACSSAFGSLLNFSCQMPGGAMRTLAATEKFTLRSSQPCSLILPHLLPIPVLGCAAKLLRIKKTANTYEVKTFSNNPILEMS